MGLRQVIKAIKQYKKFLITTHVNLEGDAIGSELAFAFLLNKLGKVTVLINEDKVPREYRFLPGIKMIQPIGRIVDFDAVVFIDCSDKSRAGKVGKFIAKSKPVINIDHHISNERFGDKNWINPEASSCTEMIHELYQKFGLSIDRKVALLLYVGILTDTGSFRYPNTTAQTHKIVGDLLRYKFPINKIYQRLYESYLFSDVKLLSSVLATLKRDENGKIVYLRLIRDNAKIKRGSVDQTENILNYARSVKGIELVVLFKELKPGKEVRINFRSRGKVDVNKLAGFFGGGGHKTASGCTMKGKLDEVEELVLRKARQMFK